RQPLDPAGRALRAEVELARLGAPRRALGAPLGLEGSTAPELVADLEAARDLEGAPGERAAWLLADLLLGAGREADARAALEKARARAPGSPARAVLERALATPLGPED